MRFFAASRDKVLRAVELLGDRVCCYAGASWLERICDCKYGGPTEAYSEQTGCPELRNVQHVLSVMTDAEWEALLNRENSRSKESESIGLVEASGKPEPTAQTKVIPNEEAPSA